MKKQVLFVFLQTLLALVFLISLIFLLTGNGFPVSRSFAVDSAGRLYIGRSSQIEIYENGSLINSISALTSRGYAFTIENDTIVLSTASTVYEMDLSGNVQAEYADTMSRVYHAHTENRQFTDARGNVYKRSSPWGRLQIACEGEICYQMPVGACVWLWLMGISFIGLFCVTGLLVINIVNTKKKTE